MNKFIMLFSILIIAAVLRFYRIGIAPPLIEQSNLAMREVSALFGVVNVFLVYLITKKIFRNYKPGLLSAWIMSVLPWTLEQGRIVSQVNIALPIILLNLLLIRSIKNKLINCLILLALALFYIVYPQFWLFRNFQTIPLQNFINNFFSVISPDMWFFRNISFYHAGLRDWGFIYLTMFPVLIIGLYATAISKLKWLILLLIGLGAVTSASPFFPETSEFFLAIPVISLILATGFYRLFSYLTNHGITFKILSVIYILLITYEISQLLHFYFVHYPQQVMGSITEIQIPF